MAAVGGEKQTIGRSSTVPRPGHLVDPGVQNLPNRRPHLVPIHPQSGSRPRSQSPPHLGSGPTIHDCTKGWEYFDIPSSPSSLLVMLEAANTAQENHLTNATSNNTADTSAVWTPLPTAPVPSTHTASGQPAPPRHQPAGTARTVGLRRGSPPGSLSFDRPGREDSTSLYPNSRFSPPGEPASRRQSHRALRPPPPPPYRPDSEPVRMDPADPSQQNHPPASPWAPWLSTTTEHVRTAAVVGRRPPRPPEKEAMTQPPPSTPHGDPTPRRSTPQHSPRPWHTSSSRGRVPAAAHANQPAPRKEGERPGFFPRRKQDPPRRSERPERGGQVRRADRQENGLAGAI